MPWPQAGSAFNIGIMLFRQGSLAFAQVLLLSLFAAKMEAAA